MPWPHPADGNIVCCDDFQPCFCNCVDWDDYDATKKEREERLRELEAFETAAPEVKRAYYEGRIKYADVVRPIPTPQRRYPRFTWRASDNIETIVNRVVGEVQRAERGGRNNTLSASAFFFGKLVQSGRLDIEHAVYQLGQAARAAGLPLSEAATTVRLGLQAGMREEASNPYERRPSAMAGGPTRSTVRA